MPMYFEDLQIKTLTGRTPQEIDSKCAEFRKYNMIKATQTNVVYDSDVNSIFYVYTLLYLPKNNMPQAVEEVAIQKTPKEEKIISKIPNMIIPEEEAQWTDCLICVSKNLSKRRWKWTHYRLCPNMHGIEGLSKEHHEKYNLIWKGDGNYGKEGIDSVNKELQPVL